MSLKSKILLTGLAALVLNSGCTGKIERTSQNDLIGLSNMSYHTAESQSRDSNNVLGYPIQVIQDAYENGFIGDFPDFANHYASLLNDSAKEKALEEMVLDTFPVKEFNYDDNVIIFDGSSYHSGVFDARIAGYFAFKQGKISKSWSDTKYSLPNHGGEHHGGKSDPSGGGSVGGGSGNSSTGNSTGN